MSTALPWDRFPNKPLENMIDRVRPEPAPSSAEPELLPPAPAQPPPVQAPVAQPSESLNELIQIAARDLLQEAMGYAKASVNEIIKGQTVDVLNPTVTATTTTGRELVVADAKSRSWRTLIQGLIFDVFAAIVAAVALLAGLDPFQKETWIAFGVLLLKSVVSAVISYFMRLRVTPTIRTEGEKLAIMPVPRPMIGGEKP